MTPDWLQEELHIEKTQTECVKSTLWLMPDAYDWLCQLTPEETNDPGYFYLNIYTAMNTPEIHYLLSALERTEKLIADVTFRDIHHRVLNIGPIFIEINPVVDESTGVVLVKFIW